MGTTTKNERVSRRAVLAGAVAAAAIPLEAHAQTYAARARASVPVDLVVIVKKRRLLQLVYRDRVMRTYRVALGQNPVGREVFLRQPAGLPAVVRVVAIDFSHRFESFIESIVSE